MSIDSWYFSFHLQNTKMLVMMMMCHHIWKTECFKYVNPSTTIFNFLQTRMFILSLFQGLFQRSDDQRLIVLSAFPTKCHSLFSWMNVFVTIPHSFILYAEICQINPSTLILISVGVFWLFCFDTWALVNKCTIVCWKSTVHYKYLTNCMSCKKNEEKLCP